MLTIKYSSAVEVSKYLKFKVNCLLSSILRHLFTNELIMVALFISAGILFQIKASEYDRLFLNVFSFGLGILKTASQLERFRKINWRNISSDLIHYFCFIYENHFLK